VHPQLENIAGQPARRRWKFGCVPRAFVVGALFMGTGIWLMTRWETLGGAAKAGAVMLVVFGTLLMLPLVLIALAAVVIRYWFRRVTKDLEKATADMTGQTKAMYDRIHEFRDATNEDFKDVDQGAYEQAARDFADAGFRSLGDVIDQTIAELGQTSPPIRVMASADGTTLAALYHFKNPMMPQSANNESTLICDLTSEFDDGSFLVTSNTEGLDLMTPPPQIQRRQLPLETASDMQRARHETEKQKLLAAKSGATCIAVSTLGDALEMEKRQQAIKNAFRKGIGYLDPAEVRRIASKVAEKTENDQTQNDQ
jgi:hypothetical protein